MQVFPANWSNPAAAVQQAMQNPRNPSASEGPATNPAIPDVGKAEKTGDRDANERYNGPQAPPPKEAMRDSKDESGPPLQERFLPADNGEEAKLDLLG